MWRQLFYRCCVFSVLQKTKGKQNNTKGEKEKKEKKKKEKKSHTFGIALVKEVPSPQRPRGAGGHNKQTEQDRRENAEHGTNHSLFEGKRTEEEE